MCNLPPGVAGVTLVSALGPLTCPRPRTHGVQLVRYMVVRTLAVVLMAMTSGLLRPPVVKQGVLALKLPPSSILGGGGTGHSAGPFPLWHVRGLSPYVHTPPLSPPLLSFGLHGGQSGHTGQLVARQRCGKTPRQCTNTQGVLNWTASAGKLAPRPLPVIRDAGEYSCVLRPFLGLLIHSMGHLLAA